jgi:hypothetical protein
MPLCGVELKRLTKLLLAEASEMLNYQQYRSLSQDELARANAKSAGAMQPFC